MKFSSRHCCIYLFVFFSLISSSFHSQNAAPDFYATDINNNEWHLQELLDSGKTVILEFSATWCPPCWSYHLSGSLEYLHNLYGPSGSDDLSIFFIESDLSTDNDDLFGFGDYTQGDFGGTMAYPIIDGVDGYQISQSFGLTYYPYILTVCPNGEYFESGAATAESHYNMIQEQCGFQPPYPTISHTIAEVQGELDSSPLIEQVVTVQGVITAASYNGYFIQDGAGPWNGVFVYDNTNLPAVGDNVILQGEVIEYYDLTEITNITYFETVSTGNDLPAAVELTTGFIGTSGEPFEGCRVKVSNAACTNPSSGYNAYFDDGSGDCAIGNLMYTPDSGWILGEYYSVTGVLTYMSEEYKIEPSSAADVSIGTPPNTIYDIVSNSPDHTTLETALVVTGLEQLLSEPDTSLTLFAPTDNAFAVLPVGVIDLLLVDPTTLMDMIKHHIVGSLVMSSDLSNGMMITTLQGEEVMVSIDEYGVFINNALVTVADIQTDNGIVHIIDALLIPTGTDDSDIDGCTDPFASNYNPEATQDDGSCQDDDEGNDTTDDGDPTYNNVVWSNQCEVDNCSEWQFGNVGDYDINFYCSYDGPIGPSNTWAGADQGGEIAPPMNSSTSHNGILIVDSDAYSSGGGGLENCWVQTIDPINCSELEDVTISFQTRYRCWDNGSNDGNERCYIEISRDGENWPSDYDYEESGGYIFYETDNLNDTTVFSVQSRYEVFPTYNTGDQSSNPEYLSLNISSAAAEQGQVWIRFRWVGTWGYSWEIDDIYVYQTPEYDIAIDNYFSYTDYERTGIIEYGAWPLSQLPNELQAGVKVINNGTVSQTPELLMNYHNSSQLDDLGYGVPLDGWGANGNLALFEFDTLTVSFDPETLGTYFGNRYLHFNVGGDVTGIDGWSNSIQQDENLDNNYAMSKFEITEYSFGRDNGEAYAIGPDIYANSTNNCYGASTLYQIQNEIEIYGIDIAVMEGSEIGAWADVFLGYQNNLEMTESTSGDIIYQNFEYQDTSYNNQVGTNPEDIQWYTIKFENSVYLDSGEVIYAGIFSESLESGGFKYGISQSSHDNTSYIYSCNDGQMYWTERTPMIRLNLNPDLNDDGDVGVFFGCTDSSACNYNPSANDNDGSCWYPEDEGYCNCEGGELGCTNPYACEYNMMASCDNGNCEGSWDCGYSGAFITTFTKADYAMDSLPGGPNTDFIHGDVYITRGDQQGLYNPFIDLSYMQGSSMPSGTLWKYGATDDNPNPMEYETWYESHGGNAQTLAGNTYSLYLPEYGMYWDVYYDSWTSGSNGGGFSWIRTFKPEQSGCSFEGGEGCMDEAACNYDLMANCEGYCDYESSCFGCTDPNAQNYDPDVTIDDGSCLNFEPNCDNIGLEGWENFDSGVYPETSIATYAEFTNIDLSLHINEILIEPTSQEGYTLLDFMITDVQGLPDGLASDQAQTVLTPVDQLCISFYGTPYETGFFYIEFTGIATISLFGLELELNNFTFDHLLIIEENSNPIFGCIYEGALNYDMYANMDNASCVFSGCTDPEALNFNTIFNMEDGSCFYNLTTPDCISDINMDGLVSTDDLLFLLSDFGNYCEE